MCNVSVISNTIKTLRKNDSIGMTCGVDYRGNWAPVMTWRQIDGKVIADESVVLKAVTNERVTYSLQMFATRDLDGKVFSCITSFNLINKPINTTACNLPNYNSTWTSPVLQFLGQCRQFLQHITAYVGDFY